MSESESEPQTDNTPRFSRAMIGRVSAVGLFVVLGTFAVIQSMGSADHDDQVASADLDAVKSADSPANSSAKPDNPKDDTAANPSTTSQKPALPNPFPSLAASKESGKKPGFSPISPSAKPNGFSTRDDENGFGAPPLTAKPSELGKTKPNTIAPPARYAQSEGRPIIGSQKGFQVRQDSPTTSSGFNPSASKNTPTTNPSKPALLKPPTQFPGSADLPVSGAIGDAPKLPGSAPIGGLGAKPDTALRAAAEKPPTDFSRALSPFPADQSPPIDSRTPDNSALSSARGSGSANNQNRIIPLGGSPNGLAAAAAIGTSTAIGTAALKSTRGSATTPAAIDNTTRQSTSPRSTSPFANDPAAIAPFGGSPTNPASRSVGIPRSTETPAPTVAPDRPIARQPATQRPFDQRPIQPRNTTSAIPASTALSGSRLIPSRPIIPTTATNLSQNLPGDRQLEGVQAPALTIEKLSPRETQVNRPADFQIVIKNVGRATAENVHIFDQVPAGTDYLSASPEPTRMSSSRELEWDIGKLRPGQEKRIRIKLKPTRPGEIGSVAHFTFSAQASMRTLVTKPVLEITHHTRQSVLIGDDVILDVTVKNKGDGPAHNVLIQEDVPEQLEFQDGYRELEYEIGTLMPGQSRQLRLALKAANVGKFRNVMFATGDGGLQSRHGIDMEIIAPKLVTQTDGPTRRFLQRNVTHQFNVTNSGTAPATNVELIARLPAGLRFISTNNQGFYVADKHAVFWSLPELARGVDAKVELKTVPVEVGNQPIKFEAFADLNTRSVSEHPLSVEHLVDVSFSIDDVIDPIEIGASTNYRIRIVNQGTKTASNVQFQVGFPPGIQPTSVDGSLKHRVTGQTVLFDPINSLAPGDEISVIVHGTGTLEGDHRVVLTMKTDGRSTPVSKEETTRVYSDR